MFLVYVGILKYCLRGMHGDDQRMSFFFFLYSMSR